MKKALVVGGANGIGLAIAIALSKRDDYEKVYIIDKVSLLDEYRLPKMESWEFDLNNSDYSIFNQFSDIDTLMITAGFGRLALFKDVDEQYIINSFNVNTVSALRIVRCFYDKLENKTDFFCGIMVSIAGFMSSPFYAIYGATKAALKIFIESVNVELEKSGSTNRILNVSPGSIQGTKFHNNKNDLSIVLPLADEIISHLHRKDDLFIPKYEEVYKAVLQRYYDDFRLEGLHSYEYKQNK